MRKLYSARVARPLSTTNHRPTRLGFDTTAWCKYEDIIAVISGDGAVAVFHTDSPGEVALLVGFNRAPARHVCWRNTVDKPCMLVVADAAGRITFWVARDRRVNVWTAAASVDVASVAVAVGWNASCTALAAVLASGGLAVWSVPDLPAEPRRRQHSAYASKSRDRRSHPPEIKAGAVIRELPCKNHKLADMFGGQLRCGTVAPGYVDPTSVAVVTVSAAQPKKLNVWQVSLSKTNNPSFEVRPLSSTEMHEADYGRCVACAAVPKSGMLFAIGDRGVVVRWFLKNSRPTGDTGWVQQATARIDEKAEKASATGLIAALPQSDNNNVNAITRGLQVSKKRKVYAFQVSSDCKTLVTSTSAGLLVWDTDKLEIVSGHTLTPSMNGTPGSSYWGLCISPGGAAVMALNGQGRVDALSLILPITTGTPETVSNAAMSVAKRLAATTHTDGLRGGWDLIASVAVEGTNAANMVAKMLTPANMRSSQAPPMSAEKLGNLKSLMMHIVYPEENVATSANRLLEVAVDAIRQSAPDFVKLRLMASVKDAKQYTSADHIRKLIRQGISSTRVNVQQLAAAPLADWIMVLCSVWLQRCASAVVTHDSKGQMGTGWGKLASLALRGQAAGAEARGMVSNAMLIRALRPACVAAVVLLALEEEHGEPEADARYFRFSQNNNSEVVAALWEVSMAWDAIDAMSRPPNGGSSPGAAVPGQNMEQISNTAIALGKHALAAVAIAEIPKVRVLAAERALGLHGSGVGAGFIMSCSRRNHGSLDQPQTDSKNLQKTQTETKTEWCPYDLVTGRPLPPWAPLRRCIVSGLLAAEITQQKSDQQTPSADNAASPWISKWANESPFGGRWARVPSLDLDRYELLPSVPQTSAERGDTPTSTMLRQPKPEQVLGHTGMPSGMPPGMPPGMPSGMPSPMGMPPTQPQMQAPGFASNHQSPMSVPSAAEAAALAVHGGTPMAHMLMNGNPQMPHGVAPGMAGNAMLQNPLAGRLASSRVQASPGMSTASSTTDPGSTTSKGTRKRASANGGPRGRVRKRVATEPRTPTPSQMSDLAGSLGANGIPNASSPAPMSGMVRTNSAADALSSDTRSTMTTATNATGGVDQDTSKSVRKPRRRSRKSSKQNAAAAAAAAAGASAAAAAAAVAGVPPGAVSAGLPPGVPPTLSQTSIPSQAAQTPRTAAQAKKQMPRGVNRNQGKAAAAAHAAAAAAAAAAASLPVNSAQSPLARNQAMLQAGLNPEGMAAAGISKTGDAMLGFSANGAGPAGQVMGGPRRGMTAGGNMSMMGNANAAGLALNGAALQQGNFAVQGGDGNLAGMNGQNTADAAGFANLTPTGGANGQIGTPGASLATLALNLGLTPNQLTGLTPGQAQMAIDALSRRAALQAAAGMGGAPGNVQGSSPSAANPGMLVSTPLNTSDLNAATPAPGMGPMVAGHVSGGLSHLGGGLAQQQQHRGMVNNAAAQIGSIGLSLGGPRTSAAESQTSVRVTTAGLPGRPAGSAEREGMGLGGRAQDRGQRVWKGNLHVRGHRNDMMVPCVAIQYNLSGKPPIRDTSGWPAQLQCDSSKLTNSTQVLEDMSAPNSQWYVRFAPIDANGVEREESKLIQLVVVMVERKLAFEIKCNEGMGTPGTLYLWGMQIPPHGHSMLGVFRPDIPPAAGLGVDQELQLMMMGAGSK